VTILGGRGSIEFCLGGRLARRLFGIGFGRQSRSLLAFVFLALLTDYPALAWLVRETTFDRHANRSKTLWLSLIYAC